MAAMKDVIDVLQLQKRRLRGDQNPAIDYRKSQDTFVVIRFIFECGTKLAAERLTIATASTLYHRFFREADVCNYDPYLIAATTLYLAGKTEDEPIKIRDIINVTHATLHRGIPPLELGDEYWNMRDAIVQGELLIMRMLKFEVTCTHPHKFLLHYLKTLKDWIDPELWKSIPLTRTSLSFLQDFYHSPAILNYKPQHVAATCVNLALQCYGVTLPFQDSEEIGWYTAFTEGLAKEIVWEITEKVMDVYEKEGNVLRHCEQDGFS